MGFAARLGVENGGVCWDDRRSEIEVSMMRMNEWKEGYPGID